MSLTFCLIGCGDDIDRELWNEKWDHGTKSGMNKVESLRHDGINPTSLKMELNSCHSTGSLGRFLGHLKTSVTHHSVLPHSAPEQSNLIILTGSDQ